MNFTEKTIDAIGFEDDTAFAIFPDSERPDCFYLKKTTRVADPQAFVVKKSGKYWYMNTKTLFSSLGLPFKEKTIIFDMHRALEVEKEAGGEWYELNMRTIEHAEEAES